MLYGENLLLLADKDRPFDFDDSLFEEAAQIVYDNHGFIPDQLSNPAARAVIGGTLRILQTAINSKLPTEVPETIRYALENNAFVFSGFKTYHALREVGLSLLTDKGDIKPFDDFLTDVRKINAKYNHNYLYAEYNHAVGASQMAAKWHDFEQDGDRYDLQYRTAGDDRVREEHAALNGITLPPDDPFWSMFLPPNGWNCRCTTVQVGKNKYPLSDTETAMWLGENCTGGKKGSIFRYNAGKSLQLFPPKHPYYKAPEKAKQAIEQVTQEAIREKRIETLQKQLPDNLTDAEKDAIASNNYELEQALGIMAGKPMTVEEADRQSANPAYVPKFLIDEAGMYRDKHARYRLNPAYDKKRDEPNGINCQTCAPAYALRLMGFNVTAKPNTRGSKLEYLSRGMQCWEAWKNTDGTPAQHTSLNGWLAAKGYQKVTPKRYLQFFDEVCKEVGVYELSIGWKGGGGHATILQRFADGALRYIEPQADNSEGTGYEWKNLEYLANEGATKNHECRGIMRIDNKLFNVGFIDIFNKEVDNV